MEELIRQAFLHVKPVGPHIIEGNYDLIDPNGEVILARAWETTVEPGWSISMKMLPMPQPPGRGALAGSRITFGLVELHLHPPDSFG
jgi:hypothetical protein